MSRERVKRVRASDPDPAPEDKPQSSPRDTAPKNAKVRDPLPPAWSRPGKNQQPLGYRRTPQRITEAIEMALTRHGMDGRGKNGLPGYFYHLAKTDPKAMAHLIAKIMPNKVQASVDPQSALGQTLEAVRSRIAFEKARTINATPAVALPPFKGS